MRQCNEIGMRQAAGNFQRASFERDRQIVAAVHESMTGHWMRPHAWAGSTAASMYCCLSPANIALKYAP